MEQSAKNQTFIKVNNTTFKIDIQENDLSVVVGDEKQPDFKPRLKIKKWDNEVNFSVGLIEEEGIESSFTYEDDKINWSQGKREAHFIPIENGFELEILLKEKPVSNIIELSIQTKGLDFFYQPFLTEEEKLAKEIYRPENVEGSYAVYHKTKRGDYSKLGGKNYQTGKAFHIYRPKIFDADGKWAWGKLNIDIEKGILSIEIPQSIIDRGKYPLLIDPTFGYTTAGSSYISIGNYIRGSVFTGAAGTGDSISVYLQTYSACRYKFNIYKHSDLSQVTNGQTAEGTGDGSTGWKTLNFVSSPTLEAIDYVLVAWSEVIGKNTTYIWYDAGNTNQGHYQNLTYGTWPNPLVPTHDNNVYSIYCTYTAAGGQTYYQNLSATEVAVCSLLGVLLRTELLSVIESSIASLSKIANYYKSLIVTEVSNVVMSLSKTFYRTLSVIENSIVSLVKGLFKTLSVVESSVVSLITAKFFSKILSVIESSVVSLLRITTYLKSLLITEVSVITMSLVKTFYRTLSVIESSIASLIKGISKNLSVVESSIVSLTKGLFYAISMVITEVSVATISKISTFFKSLLTTEISVPSLGKIANYFRSLSVIENSIVGLGKVASFFRSLVVTEISIPVISLIKTFYRTLSLTMISIVELIATKIAAGVNYVNMVVTEVSIATIGLVKNFYRTLSVVENSIVSLIKGLFKNLTTTEISIPSLTKISQYFISLSVVENSVVMISKISTFFKSLLTTEISIPILDKISSYFRRLEVTVVSLPVLRRATTFFKQIYATMISVPNLIAKKLEKVMKVIRHISLSRFIRWF